MPVFKKNGELSEIMQTTLRELFRRMDKIHLGGSLGHAEFNTFLKQAIGETISQDYFKFNVLTKFASNNQKEVCLRGFLDWFKMWIQERGINTASKIFESLGYDEDLYPMESRSFSMSIHSP